MITQQAIAVDEERKLALAALTSDEPEVALCQVCHQPTPPHWFVCPGCREEMYK